MKRLMLPMLLALLGSLTLTGCCGWDPCTDPCPPCPKTKVKCNPCDYCCQP